MTTWTDIHRHDLTFSLEDADDARNAASGAMIQCDQLDLGYRLSGPDVGGWRGLRESSYTLTIVGALATIELNAILRAIHAGGCEAVQVETWAGPSYEVREVRP